MVPVLDRITSYRNQKGWTEYQLATKSGLTQSTISSWYRKDLVPSIPSLEKYVVLSGLPSHNSFLKTRNPMCLPKRREIYLKHQQPLRRTTACINRIYKDSLKGYAYSPRIAFSLTPCII